MWLQQQQHTGPTGLPGAWTFENEKLSQKGES